ncbi:MAG: PAS domain S-box protein [Ignavibacteriales bacterium]|nr:MAG: PAS domain S-box protein [Ignavibacteriales bacterium]
MFQFNDFCAVLVINTIISFVITIYSWLKLKTESGKYFIFLMAAITIWTFSATFELSFTTLDQKILWSKISYFGIVSVSPFWFLFACYYSKIEKIISSFIKIAIWIIPVTILFLALTNEYHGAVWPEITLTNSDIGIIAVYQNGWGKLILLIYSYILLLTGTVILISFATRTKQLYLKQIFLLSLSALFPWIGNALYYFRIGPFAILDFTPVFFTITGILLLWDILNFRLLDIMPVAYDTLFENMSDGVIVVDNEERIIEINPSISRLFNFDNSVGQSLKKMLSNYPEIISYLYSIQTEPKEFSVIIEDQTYWLDIRVTSLINSYKKPGGKLIVIRDITQKKKSEIELAESEKKYRELNDAKDKFIRIISHDLKSPFQGMIGLSKLLSEEIEELTKSEIKEFSRELNLSIQSQFRLLEDLLSLSKVQSEKITVLKKQINVYSEVNNIFQLFEMLAQSKHIQLLNHISEDIVLHADPDMFRLMLRNLISNAIKFTNSGGTVSMSSMKNKGEAIFIVEDNGIGIDEINIPKLFRLDYHFTTKGTAEETGTGFGLILCKEVIDKHEGRIWVESEVGKGSRFYFTFPN